MMSERVGSDMKTGDVFKVSPRDWGAVSPVESLSPAVDEGDGKSTEHFKSTECFCDSCKDSFSLELPEYLILFHKKSPTQDLI